MRRIFIVNDRVSGGGAEVVMKNLVSHLQENYKITIMTMDNDFDTFKKIFPNDVEYKAAKIIYNPYHKLNPLRYLIKAYNLIRKVLICSRKYDIVIANKEGPCMKLVSKMRASKKLAWVHADYQYLYWTRSTFSAQNEVKCMKKFDSVICVTKAVTESIKKVIGDPGNLCVRYNPIDYHDIIKKAEAASEIKRDYSKPLFVAVGRIVKEKNYTTLAKVCTRLCKEFEFELWIVGDGNQRNDIEQILSEQGCSCVKILGMQSNPYKYLLKADFLVSTSLCESYGLVIQEALVLGVPVISTKCPAIEECFDTRFGMLVDCDEADIEKGMRYILEKPECISKYKQVIKNEYNVTSLWDERLNEITRLIEQKNRRRML